MEEDGNAKAQGRREENDKDAVLACPGMGILPMSVHGSPARGGAGEPLLPKTAS